MNFFMEIAKMRAARLLWAKLDQAVRPEEPQIAVAAHPLARPRVGSLTAQDVYNNVVRTCIEAMASTQGHTQ